MAGYWQRPDETAKAMTADGFFRSGDMGFMDERGYTKIVDRKGHDPRFRLQRLSERGGRSGGQPSGRAGMRGNRCSDEHSGETVKLFVVKKDQSLTEAEAQGLLRQEPDELQTAENHRVPHRAAEIECRQNLAARIAQSELIVSANGESRATGSFFHPGPFLLSKSP